MKKFLQKNCPLPLENIMVDPLSQGDHVADEILSRISA